MMWVLLEKAKRTSFFAFRGCTSLSEIALPPNLTGLAIGECRAKRHGLETRCDGKPEHRDVALCVGLPLSVTSSRRIAVHVC